MEKYIKEEGAILSILIVNNGRSLGNYSGSIEWNGLGHSQKKWLNQG